MSDLLALAMIFSTDSEHAASGGKPATPSFCILPLFHAKLSARSQPNRGYISMDGHQFLCKNPASVQQPFHMWVLAKLPISELITSYLQYLFD